MKTVIFLGPWITNDTIIMIYNTIMQIAYEEHLSTYKMKHVQHIYFTCNPLSV